MYHKIMITRFIILFFLIIFSSKAFALKLEKGEIYQGEIKKVESYMYNFNLPSGEWEVMGLDRSFDGRANSAYIVFAKIVDNNVEAFIWLILEREPSDSGWIALDPGVCTDWDGQGSNFHKNDYNRSNGTGSCLAVYAIGDVWPGIYDESPEFVQTKKKLKRLNVKLPDAILWIEQELMTKDAAATSYIGINPEAVGIKSKPNQEWTYSDWDKYNISDYPQKDSYMKKAIRVGEAMQEQNFNALKKRNIMDLSFIDDLLKQ